MLDKRVSSLTSIDAISEIAKVVLCILKLGDSSLIWHIRPRLYQLGTKHYILLTDLGVLEFILCNGEGACSMVLDIGSFFL